MHRFWPILFLCLLMTPGKAQVVPFDGNPMLVGDKAYFLEDSSKHVTYPNIAFSTAFKPLNNQTPNFNLSASDFWLKFSVKNVTQEAGFYLLVDYPLLDHCDVYWEQNGKTNHVQVNDHQPLSQREINHQNPTFFIPLSPDSTATFYLRASGSEQVIIPVLLSAQEEWHESNLSRNILNGLQIGILLVMMLYNFFVYLSIRDRSYIYYVFYIFFIGLTQATLSGYTIKYLWPNHPEATDQFIILFPGLAGIFAIKFIQDFLSTREKTPTLHNIITWVLVPYGLAPMLRFAGFDMISYRFIDLAGLSGGILTLIISGKLAIRGYRPAIYFFVAWVIFILGLILYVLRNFDIAPYNLFTNNSMQIGTAIEVTLLSLALADKINTLRKEKEQSQLEALAAAEENQRLVREQNVILETRVTERTQELTSALSRLKETQTKLVEAEKMSSLGQLTAGIAHEINNPINFITSNIRPLHRDIKDLVGILDEYSRINPEAEIKPQLDHIEQLKKKIDAEYVKQEMDMLVAAISDGANRTSAIVKGLRSFSRLDELDLRYADIHEGIDSTLLLLQNKTKDKVEIVKQYDDLPQIECYIGRLNQVFMNILTNSLQALEHAGKTNAKIEITTRKLEDKISISFKDNGPGMTEEVKNRIFEPFFTTKGVGEGTGLGLSIVYTIVETHGGSIQVKSAPGEGAEFIITIPQKQ